LEGGSMPSKSPFVAASPQAEGNKPSRRDEEIAPLASVLEEVCSVRRAALKRPWSGKASWLVADAAWLPPLGGRDAHAKL